MFRRSHTEQVQHPVTVALTDAFFDMDKRQSIAESAVEASEQLFPERQMRQLWAPVVDVCYAAAAAYLAVTGDVGIDHQAGPGSQSEPSSPETALRQLTAASQAVDQFYSAHRTHLERALAMLSAVPNDAQQAASAANAARHALTGSAQFAEYPSVRAASIALQRTVSVLDSALAAGSARAIRGAAAQVRTAATALELALTNAPQQELLARQSLTSVTTRLSAVSTRAERLAPAFSSLLREFNAASSADLTGNERASRGIIEQAEAELTEARAELLRGNPERARELAVSLRASLARAEELVDAVTDRLDLLRTVRNDPRAKEAEVRFKLRDAQMLAVSRGFVKEWASVLDAQAERIDRVAGQLNGRNPDYWGYVSGLDGVATFISGVVQRMRTRAPDSPLSGSP